MMYVARRPEDGTIFDARPEPFEARVGGKPVRVEAVHDDDGELVAFLNPPEPEPLTERVARLERMLDGNK